MKAAAAAAAADWWGKTKVNKTREGSCGQVASNTLVLGLQE